LSSKDLRNLFKLRHDTPSDTHDKLKCERCRTITDDAEIEARKLLPKKLSICLGLVDKMLTEEDASFFATPIIPSEHGVSKDDYESKVKQPIDLGTVRSKLEWLPDKPSGYESISGFSKDLNRVFANVLKVWAPGSEIAEAARRLQAWWIDEWTQMVPTIMSMKSDNDEPNLHDQHQASKDTPTFSESNERGENYQEQIGLPDEEDMRCWSHHHSVDTVDDPVFRAAMRGYDSVSFVFGLEVTWSLIQQRKQEEEEKLAMLEFEEAQKCEGGTNHSENSGDERDITPSVKEEESDGELCCTPQDLECNKIIKEGMSESYASSEGHFPDLNIQVENGESSECTNILHMPNSDMKSTASVNGDWICVSCTFSNTSTRKTCAMCKVKRVSVEGDSRWECPSCTYKNPESKRACVMCKLRRGSPNKKLRCR
jgi:Bromodomain/Zn-finger in Ran binding protein and others